MSEPVHPLVALTDAGLDALLRRAVRVTLVLGVLAALVVWKASGWRNATMLAAGAAISAASILEWQRLVRFISAKLDRQQAPRGAAVAAVFFVVRLIVFAGVIYGSLKWFKGSAVALLCGLGLAALSLLWEALSLLRN
jgi:uncharacterized membrane protein